MKKIKVILCLFAALITVFAITACNGTFDGDFRQEATAEEIEAVTADIKAATGDEGTAALTSAQDKALKSEMDLEISVNTTGESNTLKIEAVQQSALTADNKLQLKSESKLKVNDKSLEVNVYSENGELYMDINGSKLKVGTELSASLGFDASAIAEIANGLEYVSEPVDELTTYTTQQLADAGIRVYIDKSDEFTKIKYALSAKAVAQIQDVQEVDIQLKNYYIIVVLDADKKLYGVKVFCDFTVNNGGSGLSMKMEGSVAKSDDKIKFDSFDDYEEATAETLAEAVKSLSDIFSESL